MTSKQCPQCGSGNEAVASKCSNCGFDFFNTLKPVWSTRGEGANQETRPQPKPPAQTESDYGERYSSGTSDRSPFGQYESPNYNPGYRPTDWSTVLGFVGSAVLFIGVFTPIVSLPIVGSFNYFQNGMGDGVLVIALSIISAILILARWNKGLFITGGLSLAMFAFTYFSFQYRMSSAKTAMKGEMEGNPFAGIGDAFLGSIQLGWGWAVLILGAVMLIGAAAMVDARRRAEFPGLLGALSGWLGDSKRLVPTICVVAFLAIGLLGFNFLLNTDVSKRVSNFVNGFFPNREQLAFKNALSVEFLGKEFQKADPYSGQFSDRILVKLELRNTSVKPIKSIRGTLKFTDSNGDPVKTVDFNYAEGLETGASRRWVHSLDHYAFTARDDQFKDMPLERLNFEFVPDYIYYSDGTKIERSSKP